MIKSFLKTFWAFGLFIAIGLALLLSIIFSAWSWAENPGGIFRDSAGTNWNFVYDTAISWFVPTFLNTFIIASLLHLVTGKLLSLYHSKKPSSRNDAEDA